MDDITIPKIFLLVGCCLLVIKQKSSTFIKAETETETSGCCHLVSNFSPQHESHEQREEKLFPCWGYSSVHVVLPSKQWGGRDQSSPASRMPIPTRNESFFLASLDPSFLLEKIHPCDTAMMWIESTQQYRTYTSPHFVTLVRDWISFGLQSVAHSRLYRTTRSTFCRNSLAARPSYCVITEKNSKKRIITKMNK